MTTYDDHSTYTAGDSWDYNADIGELFNKKYERGTVANRPAASDAPEDAVWHATDQNLTYRNDATNGWVVIGHGNDSNPVPEVNANSVNTDELNNTPISTAADWSELKTELEALTDGDKLIVPGKSYTPTSQATITGTEITLHFLGTVFDTNLASAAIKWDDCRGVSWEGTVVHKDTNNTGGRLMHYAGAANVAGAGTVIAIETNAASVYADKSGTYSFSTGARAYRQIGDFVAYNCKAPIVYLYSDPASATSQSVQVGDINVTTAQSYTTGQAIKVENVNDVQVGRVMGDSGSDTVEIRGPVGNIEIEAIDATSWNAATYKEVSTADGKPNDVHIGVLKAPMGSGGPNGAIFAGEDVGVDYIAVQNSGETGVIVQDSVNFLKANDGYVKNSNRDAVTTAYDVDVQGGTTKDVKLSDLRITNDNSVDANVNWGSGAQSGKSEQIGGRVNNGGGTKLSGTPKIVRDVNGYVTEASGSVSTAIDATGVNVHTISHGMDSSPNPEDIELTMQKVDAEDFALGWKRVAGTSGSDFDIRIKVTTASATSGATADVYWHATALTE